jgi:hypothetical protein
MEVWMAQRTSVLTAEQLAAKHVLTVSEYPRVVVLRYSSFIRYTNPCLPSRAPFRAGRQFMRTRRTLVPCQKGTKKWLRQYGSQCVCVQYRYDPESRLRFTTVELIIEGCGWWTARRVRHTRSPLWCPELAANAPGAKLPENLTDLALSGQNGQ